MMTITLANRDNVEYEVKGRKPLLDELRAQGVDLPYGKGPCRKGWQMIWRLSPVNKAYL